MTLRQRQAARELTRGQAASHQTRAEGARATGRIPQGRVKLEKIPGVKFVSASGKRMRQLPTYYLKKEEQVLTGMDDDQYAAMVKKIKLEEAEKTPLPTYDEG